MKYNNIIKHAKKITDKASGARPILKGVYHNQNYIIATDSHRLIKSEVDKVNFDEHILDLKTNELIDQAQDYPNMNSVIDGLDKHIKILQPEHHVKPIKEMLKMCKALKYSQVVIESVNNENNPQKSYNELILRPHDNIDTKPIRDFNVGKLNVNFMLHSQFEEEEKVQLAFNIDYFIQAIDFIQETKEDFYLYIPREKVGIVAFKNSDLTKENYTYIVNPLRVV